MEIMRWRERERSQNFTPEISHKTLKKNNNGKMESGRTRKRSTAEETLAAIQELSESNEREVSLLLDWSEEES